MEEKPGKETQVTGIKIPRLFTGPRCGNGWRIV